MWTNDKTTSNKIQTLFAHFGNNISDLLIYEIGLNFIKHALVQFIKWLCWQYLDTTLRYPINKLVVEYAYT